MDQLADRIARILGDGAAIGRLAAIGAARAAAIAAKLSGGRIEPRQRRKAPFARVGRRAFEHHARVEDFGALAKCACRDAVGAGFAAKRRFGDRQADHRAAGNAVDPMNHAIGTGLKQERRSLRLRGCSGGRLAARRLIFVDPANEFADLAGPAFDRSVGRCVQRHGGRRGCLGHHRRLRQRHRCTAQTGQRAIDAARQIRPACQHRSRHRAGRGQHRQPVRLRQLSAAQHDRCNRRNIIGVKRHQRRKSAVLRNRPRTIAADRFGNARPQNRQRVQAATNIVIIQLIAALSQNIGELAPCCDAGAIVRRRLTQDGRDHRVSSHAKPAPHLLSLVTVSLPASVNPPVMKVPSPVTSHCGTIAIA